MSRYDVIIVGAGSVGVPTALSLSELGIKTLVIDERASPGQGENKHAIGGIRATHSDPPKIITCKRSIEVFSSWEEKYGDDIEWLTGGYCFPVYREAEEKALKGILPMQKEFGLNIDYYNADYIAGKVPGINQQDLRGGTFSPEDGSASPLLAINAFARRAEELGCDFRYKEKVTKIHVQNGHVEGVSTDAGKYEADVVIDAAGAYSKELCQTAGVDVDVQPDSHEAGITEPVEMFSPAMVVDIRPGPGSKNYYFYQNKHGQVVFCITPDPPIVGTDKNETSVFLPQVSQRMLDIMPRLKNIRVRRVWRGLYPMSPDGSPIVGWNKDVQGLLHNTGMCGQGFMLGPGVGEVVARLVADESTREDKIILEGWSPDRDFVGEEVLK